jgi:hypothetical protein
LQGAVYVFQFFVFSHNLMSEDARGSYRPPSGSSL